MPTPRSHGGAALLPFNIPAPGGAGLNTEVESELMPPAWATVLKNAVYDSSGRLSVRKGWVSQTTSAVAGVVMRVHEYVKADGTTETISSTDADIFKGAATPTSVEGTLAISEGNIKFVNFNDKCIALGTGTSANPSVYTGTGNFTTVTVATGTAPTSGIGTSAFGRLWVVDSDGNTIRYSALIDETKWAQADGGGTVNMSKIWPAGQDQVVAIEEFAGDLVIFGRKNIVIWTDGQGSDLGINPLIMYVADTVPGVGCLSQFCITRAQGDMWFLSDSGVQTLSRALQDKTTPTNNVTKNVQSKVLDYIVQNATYDDLTLVHSPREDFVLLIFPGSNKVICFDTRRQMEDGTYRITEWATDLQTATYFKDRELYGSITGTVGEIQKHLQFADDGTAYDFSYSSGWLDFGPEANAYLKFVKRMSTFVFLEASTEVNFSLYYDYNTNPRTESVSTTGAAGGGLFGVSEFTGSDTLAADIGYQDPDGVPLVETEFGGGVALRRLQVYGQGGGQYLKVGCNLNTASSNFALQQINIYARVGRMA